MCTALFVHADDELSNKLTDEEVQELIAGYKDLNVESRFNAPVSW